VPGLRAVREPLVLIQHKLDADRTRLGHVPLEGEIA
jgi:hypothetical protein